MAQAVEDLPPEPSRECRCDCGQLLARRTAEGLEIKCKRCRRVVLIPWRAVKEG